MKKLELLAPGGDIDSIKAAIAAGADAVYCGLDRFNARNRATNISFDDLLGIVHLAHEHRCQVFLTCNIIIVESELPALVQLLNKIVNTNIDGIIVQDLGLLYILTHYFPSLKIHASTQLTTHNDGQILFLHQLAATRVNLSRELNSSEIAALTHTAHRHQMLVEVFVHGSHCLCFSGLCYISSVQSGNSGNRGRCSQPCRDQYLETAQGKHFPLNLKDKSTFTDLQTLYAAGVDSLKIEGRIKKFHYVHTVVAAWRKQLNDFYTNKTVNTDNSALYKVFNRGFSNAFLQGKMGKDLFIDNPRDNSAMHLSEQKGETTDAAKALVFDERTEIIGHVEQQIAALSIAKVPLQITVSGSLGKPLVITIATPTRSFDIESELPLMAQGTPKINGEVLLTRLKAINDTEYCIAQLNLSQLQNNLFLPFKELTALKKRLLFVLNNSRHSIDPIALPVLQKQAAPSGTPQLLVLLSSPTDLAALPQDSNLHIYFALPNAMHNALEEMCQLFANNAILPWFPAVLIGKDYEAALLFLETVKNRCIVTNNTGIAHEAHQRGIAWIAGPQLNITNSYSLLCLKETYGCHGAFLSNEMSKVQLKAIKQPQDFGLYYSIFHPIQLMTSRQCMLLQVSGCHKETMDKHCLPNCQQRASITNLKHETMLIEKSKGNYPSLYHQQHFLNTAIVSDIPNFAGFGIDLRSIETQTAIGTPKTDTIPLFLNLLLGKPNAAPVLQQQLCPSTCAQYEKGI